MVTKGFSIGWAVGDAVRVVRRYPLTVLVWGVILVAPLLAVVPLFLDFFLLALHEIPPEEQGGAMMAKMLALQGMVMLANMGQMVGTVAVLTAVMRAVFRFGAPPRRFFLGLGMDELRVGLTSLAVGFAAYFAVFAMMLFGGGVGFAALAVNKVVGGVVLAILIPIVLVAILAVLSRGAMIPFATGWRGDFAFEDGWRAVSGRWGRMTGLMAVVWVMVMLVQLVITTVGLVVVLAVLIPSGAFSGLAEGVPAAPPSRWVIWAWILGLFLPVSAAVGVMSTLTYAPFASAWRQIAEDDFAAMTKA